MVQDSVHLQMSIDSCQNRRFTNINLHTKEKRNLGMQRISGSMPAEQVVEIVGHKHIVATVNDGTSVMVKYGKLIEKEQQLCYAHGTHSAVCDFLYSPTSSTCIERLPFDEEGYIDAEILADLNK